MQYDLQGNGPALIMIPGLATTSRFFSTAVKNLNRDHTVVSVDLPGHGSCLQSGEIVNIESVAVELRGLIETLALNDFTLLGWSLGATVAYRYLAQFGCDRVTSLISVEQTPYLLAEPNWEHAVFGSLDATVAATLLSALETDSAAFCENLIRNSFAVDSRPDAAQESELISESQRCDPAALRQLLDDALKQDWREGIGGLKVPTLFIHGACSRVYPTPVGRWLVEHWPTTCHLEIFERSGHLPFLEEPEKFCTTVRELITSAHAS